MDEMIKVKLREVLSLNAKGETIKSMSILENLLVFNRCIAYVILGFIFWECNRLDRATSNFKKAVTLLPNSELASLGLFYSLYADGQKEQATLEMNRFAKIAPSEEYETIKQGTIRHRDSLRNYYLK